MSREQIEGLKRRLDLPSVVASYSPGGSGRSWACPKHGHAPAEGGTPSLQLYDEGRWYCFSCARGGDVLDFLALVEDRPVGDVVRQLLRDGVPAVASISRSSSGPKLPARRDPPPIDVRATWERCLRYAQRATSTEPARAYLADRLGGRMELVERIFMNEVAGIVPPDVAEPWLRRSVRSGHRLAVPMWSFPGASDSDAGSEIRDLTLRRIVSEPVGPPKVLRVPRAAPRETLVFGNPAAAIMSADTATLLIAEGATDYLAFRATGREHVIGIPGTSNARAVGRTVRAEILVLRRLGIGGPRRIVLAFHDDDAGRGAIGAFAEGFGEVVGLALASTRSMRSAA